MPRNRAALPRCSRHRRAYVLSDDRWQKLIAKKPIVTEIPTFYVTQSALTVGFSDEGKQIDSVAFWVLGDKAQFSEVIKQHHLQGEFDDVLPRYRLLPL